jgi:hypothetical protein
MQKRIPKFSCEDHAEWEVPLDWDVKRKEEIINARTGDTRLFHKLIKSQRKHSNQTEELLVGDDHFCGPEQILQGFKIHFENLAKKHKHKWLWWGLSQDMYKWSPTYKTSSLRMILKK